MKSSIHTEKSAKNLERAGFRATTANTLCLDQDHVDDNITFQPCSYGFPLKRIRQEKPKKDAAVK
jgi:hypothetical protein